MDSTENRSIGEGDVKKITQGSKSVDGKMRTVLRLMMAGVFCASLTDASAQQPSTLD